MGGNIENLGNSAFTLPVCRKNGIMNVILYGHTVGPDRLQVQRVPVGMGVLHECAVPDGS